MGSQVGAALEHPGDGEVHALITCQVRQIWAASDLKPHGLKIFKISNDPQLTEKALDVVELYLGPPDNVMVLSVDKKIQIQALDRTPPVLQLRLGQTERRTHDYKRHGTTSLYAAFGIVTDEGYIRPSRSHETKRPKPLSARYIRRG